MKNKKMKSTKKITLGIITTLLILVMAQQVFADSYALFCLKKGEVLDFAQTCPPLGTRKVTGPSNICVHLLDNGKICQASPNVCNGLATGCSETNGTQVDTKAPQLTIINPVQGEIYKERATSLVIQTDEPSDISYTDLVNGRGRWNNICKQCSSYTNKRSFKEGQNNLMFKALDESGNSVYKNMSFFLDTQKPRISKTEPKKGFTSGIFNIEFKEDNPETLMLHYGNDVQGFQEKTLNLNDECTTQKGRTSCETTVPIEAYDGQQISYWFHLIDLADNEVMSKPINLDVDTTLPLIFVMNYTIDKNSVLFTVGVIDQNFDSIEYIDNSASRPVWRTLCSSLKDNMCIKKVSGLKSGIHEVFGQVNDKAGNSIGGPFLIEIP